MGKTCATCRTKFLWPRWRPTELLAHALTLRWPVFVCSSCRTDDGGL